MKSDENAKFFIVVPLDVKSEIRCSHNSLVGVGITRADKITKHYMVVH